MFDFVFVFPSTGNVSKLFFNYDRRFTEIFGRSKQLRLNTSVLLGKWSFVYNFEQR